jgi:hypothetical protein
MDSFTNKIVHQDNYWKIRKTYIPHKYFEFQHINHWCIKQLNMLSYFIKENKIKVWY